MPGRPTDSASIAASLNAIDKIKGLEKDGVRLKEEEGKLRNDGGRYARESKMLGIAIPNIDDHHTTLKTIHSDILGSGDGVGFAGLQTVQGEHPYLPNPLEFLASLPEFGIMGGDINTVQGRLYQLGIDKASATSSPDTTESTEMLKKLLQEANLRTAVSQAQYGVFANTPILGAFAKGGTAMQSGAYLVGERGPEIVSLAAGQEVYANGTGPSGSNVRVVIEDHRTRVFIDEKEVRAIVKDETRQRRSPLAGARGI